MKRSHAPLAMQPAVDGPEEGITEAEGAVALAHTPSGEGEETIFDSPIPNGKASLEPTLQIRKNLQETAFFLPHIRTNEEGGFSFSFTAPEALRNGNYNFWPFVTLGVGARGTTGTHPKETHGSSQPAAFPTRRGYRCP